MKPRGETWLLNLMQLSPMFLSGSDLSDAAEDVAHAVGILFIYSPVISNGVIGETCTRTTS